MDNQSLPLVTVIIASYNHAHYIEQTIDSVMQQTYPQIELLVIDDGSKDHSVALLTQLQKKYGFDLLIQQNKGLSRTLNEAIARAKGSFIVSFGSDDIMLPNRIATQIAYLKDKPEVGICASNMDIIDAEGKLYPDSKQKHRYDPFRRLNFEDVFLQRKPGAMAATLMFRKEALDKVGGFDPNIRLEDVYIMLAITHAGYFMDILPDVLSLYRQHATNTYKNLPFMFDNACMTYARFKDSPHYQEVQMRMCNSMFLKSAAKDKTLAKRILKQIPIKYWNSKTIRGLFRLCFSKTTQNI